MFPFNSQTDESIAVQFECTTRLFPVSHIQLTLHGSLTHVPLQSFRQSIHITFYAVSNSGAHGSAQ